ncbi:YybH family protein [Caballeronia ptereochthonis]|uniref:SnoaL-like domain protein n=1 Tax=Caballeronia ptereochthonis TaxID=1777144 RepID=A0A158C4A1_9BURK|nr:SgcJ/EcaC family oxidoreductase [Caballeronia ptereochthonis]SAK77159.1 SnoaL-like domain protein [Caballeronia ptereochthonis]
MNDDEYRRALATVNAAWSAAAQRWDADAFAALYTEDALFFGGRPAHSIGRDAIRAYFASYEGVIDSASLELEEQHVMTLASDCFVAQGYGVLSSRFPGNRDSRSRLRTTWIIALRDGEWRIRQHHFSGLPEKPPI